MDVRRSAFDLIKMTAVAEDKLAAIRSAFPKEGLFVEKDWLLSPDPFPVEPQFEREL